LFDDDDDFFDSAPTGADVTPVPHGQATPVPAPLAPPVTTTLALQAAAQLPRSAPERAAAAAGSRAAQRPAVAAPAAAGELGAARSAVAAAPNPATHSAAAAAPRLALHKPPAPPVCGELGGAAKFSKAQVECFKRALREHKCNTNGRNKIGYDIGGIVTRILKHGEYPELKCRVKKGTKVLLKLFNRLKAKGKL